MKRAIFLLLLATGVSVSAWAQADSTKWALDVEANNYFFPGSEYIFLPVFHADKNRLHLEARYNYEDLKTFSGWLGYNLEGGNQVTYKVTPMLGLVAGQTRGFGAGLEYTLTLDKIEWYMESEYVWDSAAKENNFFYLWSDITYSVTDHFWLGVSAQRTRLYKTELDLQRGIIVGGGLQNWELTSYFYNPHLSNPFFLVTLSVGF